MVVREEAQRGGHPGAGDEGNLAGSARTLDAKMRAREKFSPMLLRRLGLFWKAATAEKGSGVMPDTWPASKSV